MPSTIGLLHRRSSSGTDINYVWFEAMHTRFDAVLTGISGEEGSLLAEVMHSEVVSLEGVFNRFDPRSETSRINRGTGLRTGVSETMARALAAALDYRHRTGGWFDVNYLSRDGTDDTAQYVVDRTAGVLELARAGVQFDFGGFAKGYAMERLEHIVRGNGVRSALLSFGNSSVCAIGCHPHGEAWEVGVADPSRTGKILASFRLCDASLSSSGNSPATGPHIFSPRGGTVSEERAIVSVVTQSSLDCEVLSTALFAAGGAEARDEILCNFCVERVAVMPWGG